MICGKKIRFRKGSVFLVFSQNIELEAQNITLDREFFADQENPKKIFLNQIQRKKTQNNVKN